MIFRCNGKGNLAPVFSGRIAFFKGYSHAAPSEEGIRAAGFPSQCLAFSLILRSWESDRRRPIVVTTHLCQHVIIYDTLNRQRAMHAEGELWYSVVPPNRALAASPPVGTSGYILFQNEKLLACLWLRTRWGIARGGEGCRHDALCAFGGGAGPFVGFG